MYDQSLSTGASKTMHELANAIIKNKKLDKPYEKIAVVEIIFEFQREQSRGRILRALDF